MKIVSLFAEYLAIHKRLDLPGIGSFLIQDSIPADSQSGKGGFLPDTRFEANTSIRESPELVRFIAEHTGKQQTLAASDLESFLESVRQFLNIGKPYFFEGIGSLSKIQGGAFEFTPGEVQLEKVSGRLPTDSVAEVMESDTNGGFKSIFYAPKARPSGRKILVIFLLVLGMGVAIWGGYTLYNRTKPRTSPITTPEQQQDPGFKATNEPVIDSQTSITSSQPDTTNQPANNTSPPPVSAPGEYKFIVEMTDRTRGLKRYQLLKGFGLPVYLETPDSQAFKILFRLPAAASDTSRMLDSLRRLYTPAGQRAFVE